MNKRRVLGEAARFFAIVVLLLVFLYSGLQILEATVFSGGQEQEQPVVTRTITRNGVDYYPRQDITVIMVLGIDEYGPVQASGSYNNSGDADMVALAVIDETEKTVRIVGLNRDTMVEMPVLGIGGRPAGTAYQQLTLAHTYGSGLEDSCENMRTTISNLLYGLRIDYYVSMNMDAIQIANDAVGGVAVTVTDDFSQVDPTMLPGEMVLTGQQAVRFVQTRKGVGDQLNISRMERQKAYIRSFVQTLKAKLDQSETFALSLYEQVADYTVTDISANAFSGMVQRYADYELSEFVIPQGQNVLGSEYYEFYLDEAALDELILWLFYKPKG